MGFRAALVIGFRADMLHHKLGLARFVEIPTLCAAARSQLDVAPTEQDFRHANVQTPVHRKRGALQLRVVDDADGVDKIGVLWK